MSPCIQASTSTDDGRNMALEGAVGGSYAAPSTSFSETVSLMNELPPQMFGFEDYDYDDSILARVIAQSQHEYLANLKKKATSSSDESANAPVSNSPNQAGSSSTPDNGKGKSIMPKDGRH